MKITIAALACLFLFPFGHCPGAVLPAVPYTPVSFPEGSWQHFLQHLPVRSGALVDYRGATIPDQDKHYAIVDYDAGRRDLQQCADALMRLRAEYLYARGRLDEIGFHFTDGTWYSWKQYRQGWRPVVGRTTRFTRSTPQDSTHKSLRAWLDIVYTYAGTISLAKELKPAAAFEVGTVVITAGSPGHCFIIVDERRTADGKKLFKLAEGFMPAQGIYILRNFSTTPDPWYELSNGTITTRSYTFTKYKLGKFE